jgi:hypothetical protein
VTQINGYGLVLLRILKFLICLTALLSNAVFSAERKIVMDENKYVELQAAYLFNIAKFISWPEQQQEQPFRICLHGEQSNTHQQLFTDAFSRHFIGKRKIEVHQLASNNQLLSCQLVYLTSTPTTSLPSVAAEQDTLRIAAPGVLISQSVLFGLTVESGRIVIYYNIAANSEFQQPINTALLRITRAVPGGTP